MRARSALRRALFLGIVPALALTSALATRAVDSRAETALVARELPLLHFTFSRATGTDAEGYYHQPAGLSDDFPEETTTAEKIERDFAAARDTGSAIFRFGMGWGSIEGDPGQYDFRLWDQVLGTAERYGVTPIPYLCYTPAWAGAGAEDTYRRPPVDLDAFGRFAAAVAERYRGRVRTWELWNEPDNEAYWQGSPDDFARMVSGAARRIRRVDPDSVLVLGGLANGRGPFADALVQRHGVGQLFDVVNVHGYLETWSREPAEGYPGRVDAMAALLPGGPELWMAEMGYSDHRAPPGDPATFTHELYAYEHTPLYQAASLLKHLVLAQVPGKLSLTAWYRVDDLPESQDVIGDEHNRRLGVLDVNGQRKPAFYALQLHNRLFDRPVKRVDDEVRVVRGARSASVVHVFRRKSGELLVFGWLATPPQQDGVPAGAADDARSERIAIELPEGAAGKMTVYDVQGGVIESGARLEEGVIRGVELRGDGVFVAAVTR
jgi:hypothetical protein